jgi:hypothetical protein
MTGDQADFESRLKAVLPQSWFADQTPVLDSLLSGLSAAWVWVYSLLQYVTSQSRISSATGVWLDVIALDFFARSLNRAAGESDSSFRTRIKNELFRERATRNAVEVVLTELTGRAPTIFEPARATDTGGYSSFGGEGGGVGYNTGGGWGSLSLPFQCFVTAYRPNSGGIAQVAGWCSPAGAYGAGAIEYASLDMVGDQVTDADIYAAVASVMPGATTAWTQIDN